MVIRSPLTKQHFSSPNFLVNIIPSDNGNFPFKINPLYGSMPSWVGESAPHDNWKFKCSQKDHAVIYSSSHKNNNYCHIYYDILLRHRYNNTRLKTWFMDSVVMYIPKTTLLIGPRIHVVAKEFESRWIYLLASLRVVMIQGKCVGWYVSYQFAQISLELSYAVKHLWVPLALSSKVWIYVRAVEHLLQDLSSES